MMKLVHTLQIVRELFADEGFWNSLQTCVLDDIGRWSNYVTDVAEFRDTLVQVSNPCAIVMLHYFKPTLGVLDSALDTHPNQDAISYFLTTLAECTGGGASIVTTLNDGSYDICSIEIAPHPDVRNGLLFSIAA